MMIHTIPGAPNFGKLPPGPCVSTDRIRAGAQVLGVSVYLDADGVTLDGTRYMSLAAADGYLQTVGAARQMGAWVDAAQLAVDQRATAARRVAQVVAAAHDSPRPMGGRAGFMQRQTLREVTP